MTLLPLPSDEPRKPLEPIKIRPGSDVGGIAALLVSSIAEEKCITLRAIGAGAVNQAVKGTVRARQLLAGQGEDMYLIPGCQTVTGGNGEEITAIVLRCLLKDWGR